MSVFCAGEGRRRFARETLRFGAAGVVALLAVAGCRLFERHFGAGAALSRFPHDVHGESAGASCGDCHREQAGAALPMLPAADVCWSCHDDDEEAVAAFFTDGEPRWIHAGRLPAEVRFDHARHAAAVESSCSACHAAVTDASAIYATSRLRMYRCVECHESSGDAARIECEACHREIRRNTVPASHGPGWIERHGPRWSVAPGTHTADRCDLCHTQGSCDDCHTTVRPSSHTEYFRGRGHGIIAGIDRERCYVCHKRDTCDRCHSRARPRSHQRWYSAASS